MKITLPCLLLVLIHSVSSYFSKYYGRHRILSYGTDLSELRIEKAYAIKDIKNSLTIVPEKPIPYDDFDIINYRYLGAGASGEVFLMQDPTTHHFYVAKRYF